MRSLKSERREPGLAQWLVHQAAAMTTLAYLKCWHRLRIEGRGNIPTTTPFVIIANHSSHLDSFVLTACVPSRLLGSVYPIAAGDVFFSSPPVSAFAAAAINALPMWRKQVARQGLADLKARLHQGHSAYILFPEGSRSRNGEIQAFKAGVGMMVAGTSIPVVPCRLWGAFDALPPGGRLPRPRRLRAGFGPPLTFADQPDNHDGWMAITAKLREAVLAIQ